MRACNGSEIKIGGSRDLVVKIQVNVPKVPGSQSATNSNTIDIFSNAILSAMSAPHFGGLKT